MSAIPYREYRLNCGQYVYHINGEPVTAVQDTIAVAINEGHLIKHGSPEKVRAWHLQAVSDANEGGYADLVNSIVVVEGRFSLEEINKLLANAAYGSVFLAKLAADALLPIPYFPEPSGPETSSKPESMS